MNFSGVRLTDIRHGSCIFGRSASSKVPPSSEGSASLTPLDEPTKDARRAEKITAARSATNQLVWNGEIEKRAAFTVDTPKTKVFSGFPENRTFLFSDGTKFLPHDSILHWMTVSMTQTHSDAASEKWLIAATGLARNTVKIRLTKRAKKNLTAPTIPTRRTRNFRADGSKNHSCKTNGVRSNSVKE